jgi:CRISPR/Cas system-associated exonuclease Cas4 (RecB family)
VGIEVRSSSFHARNELFAYGVAVAYAQASGVPVDASQQQWLQLIDDVRALRVDVYAVAARLRSWHDT